MSPNTFIDFLFVDQKLGDFNYFDLTTLNAINRRKICQQDIFYHDFSTYLSRIVNITSTSRFPFKRNNPSQRNKWRHVNVSVFDKSTYYIKSTFQIIMSTCQIIQSTFQIILLKLEYQKS